MLVRLVPKHLPHTCLGQFDANTERHFDVNTERQYKPFSGFCAVNALADLREVLELLHVPDASKYRTHDLRRGHARDVQSSGATLQELVAAGQWSPGWTKYVDMDALESEEVECAAEPEEAK